jgi:hypothetical protein
MNKINEFAQNETLVAEAYERVKGEMAALSVAELTVPKLDVQAAVRAVLGSLSEIRKLKEALCGALTGFDVVSFDKLEDYTLALSHSNAKHQLATEEPTELEELYEEAGKLRERLVMVAKVLVPWGLFSARKVDQLKNGNGYNNVAQDLQALSAAFEEAWPKIEGKSPMTMDDVKTASHVSLRLTRLVGEREQLAAALAGATEQRQRAFTLFFRTYEEIRSSIAYVRRHHGDAEDIAPNLYTAARARPTTTTEKEDPTVTPPAAAKPVASPFIVEEEDADGPFMK